MVVDPFSSLSQRSSSIHSSETPESAINMQSHFREQDKYRFWNSLSPLNGDIGIIGGFPINHLLEKKAKKQ